MKRIAAWLLIPALILCLFACGGGDAPVGTGEGAETNATGAAPEIDPAALEEEILQAMEITEKVEAWRGQGEEGHLDVPGTWRQTVVHSLAELAPYRAYFPDLSDEDASRITSDKDGMAVVLEIASADTSLIYGVDSVCREDNQIVFYVTVAEELREEPSVDEYGNEVAPPDPGSPFEYFLFYLAAEDYREEFPVFQFNG